jgi:hypothetical protein
MVAAYPRDVLVPVEDVCQYQFTFAGGLVILVISVDAQFLTNENVALGVEGLAETANVPTTPTL